MPNIPGPVGAPGPTGGPPPNPSPTAGDVGDVLSVEQAWHKMNYGIGRTAQDIIYSGQMILHRIDVKTGLRSK